MAPMSDQPVDPGAQTVVAEPPAPPPWVKSPEHVPPPWVVSAQRVQWKVKSATKPAGEPRARWAGGDVEYLYFKGGDVFATFREGGLFGVLKTEPVAEFDADPPPAEEPAPTS